MKKIHIYLTTLLIGATLSNCGSDDKTIDGILENVTSGAVLRTRNITNNMSYNDVEKKFDTGSDYTLVIEEQDAEGGKLLESVEIFAGFVEKTRKDTNNDGTIDDKDDDLSASEALIKTLTPADFSTGSRDLPETTISFTAEELIAFTKVDESLIEGRDEFSLSFTINLTDGRSFTAADANGNVSGGSYFSSPYQYRTPIKCTITESLADTYAYTITELTSAPGGRSNCPSAPLTGEVTWSATDTPGKLTTSDISFGQFEKCYVDTFSKITPTGVAIVWECIDLTADGSIKVTEEATGKSDEFTYTYTIKEVDGSDMTIEFSNSAGDRGTVIITRPDSKIWPTIFNRS